MTGSTNTVHMFQSRHPVFYVRTVIFLVEDCLFRVPREPLEAESTVFRDMFLLPQGETVEGLTDANPVVLPGVSKEDFEQLLKALMCRKYEENTGEPLDQAQWTSVLKLATMWEFGGLRRSAIDKLDHGFDPVSPVDRLILAIQYDIKEWVLPALLKLAQRPKPISPEEGRKLGLKVALKIASVREKIRIRPRASCRYCEESKLAVGDRDPGAMELDFTPQIRAAFKL